MKLAGNPKFLANSRVNNEMLYALFEKKIHIISEGKITEEKELSFDAKSFDINEAHKEIYIGDRVNFIM